MSNKRRFAHTVRFTTGSHAEWSEPFPHAACVVALIDGLIHRVEVINIKADD